MFGSGATIWNGTALLCPLSANEIRLRHSQFQSGITRGCNNGTAVGRSISSQNSVYTSQLSISVTSQIIGRSVQCIYDDTLRRTIVGSASLRVSEGTCSFIIIPQPSGAIFTFHQGTFHPY